MLFFFQNQPAFTEDELTKLAQVVELSCGDLRDVIEACEYIFHQVWGLDTLRYPTEELCSLRGHWCVVFPILKVIPFLSASHLALCLCLFICEVGYKFNIEIASVCMHLVCLKTNCKIMQKMKSV